MIFCFLETKIKKVITTVKKSEYFFKKIIKIVKKWKESEYFFNKVIQIVKKSTKIRIFLQRSHKKCQKVEPVSKKVIKKRSTSPNIFQKRHKNVNSFNIWQLTIFVGEIPTLVCVSSLIPHYTQSTIKFSKILCQYVLVKKGYNEETTSYPSKLWNFQCFHVSVHNYFTKHVCLTNGFNFRPGRLKILPKKCKSYKLSTNLIRVFPKQSVFKNLPILQEPYDHVARGQKRNKNHPWAPFLEIVI